MTTIAPPPPAPPVNPPPTSPPPLSPGGRTAIRVLLIAAAAVLVLGSVATLGVAAWGLSAFRVITDSKPLPPTMRSLIVDTGQLPVAVRITADPDAKQPRADMRMINSDTRRFPSSDGEHRLDGHPAHDQRRTVAVSAVGPRRGDHRGAAAGGRPRAHGHQPAADRRLDDPSRSGPGDRAHDARSGAAQRLRPAHRGRQRGWRRARPHRDLGDGVVPRHHRQRRHRGRTSRPPRARSTRPPTTATSASRCRPAGPTS